MTGLGRRAPSGGPPAPRPLTLHADGDALPEAVQVVVDDAGQGLQVGLPARHQAVPADDGHRAVGVPDLLVLGLPLQPRFPGQHAGRLPVGRGAGGHQDFLVPPLLGTKHGLAALDPVGGFGCGKRRQPWAWLSSRSEASLGSRGCPTAMPPHSARDSAWRPHSTICTASSRPRPPGSVP